MPLSMELEEAFVQHCVRSMQKMLSLGRMIVGDQSNPYTWQYDEDESSLTFTGGAFHTPFTVNDTYILGTHNQKQQLFTWYSDADDDGAQCYRNSLYDECNNDIVPMTHDEVYRLAFALVGDAKRFDTIYFAKSHDDAEMTVFVLSSQRIKNKLLEDEDLGLIHEAFMQVVAHFGVNPRVAIESFVDANSLEQNHIKHRDVDELLIGLMIVDDDEELNYEFDGDGQLASAETDVEDTERHPFIAHITPNEAELNQATNESSSSSSSDDSISSSSSSPDDSISSSSPDDSISSSSPDDSISSSSSDDCISSSSSDDYISSSSETMKTIGIQTNETRLSDINNNRMNEAIFPIAHPTVREEELTHSDQDSTPSANFINENHSREDFLSAQNSSVITEMPDESQLNAQTSEVQSFSVNSTHTPISPATTKAIDTPSKRRSSSNGNHVVEENFCREFEDSIINDDDGGVSSINTDAECQRNSFALSSESSANLNATMEKTVELKLKQNSNNANSIVEVKNATNITDDDDDETLTNNAIRSHTQTTVNAASQTLTISSSSTADVIPLQTSVLSESTALSNTPILPSATENFSSPESWTSVDMNTGAWASYSWCSVRNEWMMISWGTPHFQ